MVIKKKSVLIVDDDPDFRIIVESILERLGMDIMSCATLQEATDYLKETLPDLIILDLRLGNEHGVKFLQQRIGDKNLLQIPVIVCSSENSAPLIRSVLKFQSVDYLLKPIKQAWLIQKVRKALLNDRVLKVDFSNEFVSLEISADAISTTESELVVESNIGFEKDIVIEVDIKEKDKAKFLKADVSDDNERKVTYLKTKDKSKYNRRGTYETLLVVAGVTVEDRARIKLLKSFWRFDE